MFAVGGALSLIVGLALFGSVTFLPLYFQTVDAASPTEVRAAAGADDRRPADDLDSVGQLITRTGRYKVFPIIGTALMTVGLRC